MMPCGWVIFYHRLNQLLLNIWEHFATAVLSKFLCFRLLPCKNQLAHSFFTEKTFIFSQVRWHIDQGVFCKNLAQSILLSSIFRTNTCRYNMCDFCRVFVVLKCPTQFAHLRGTTDKTTALKVNNIL